jgi:hypothetical protein
MVLNLSGEALVSSSQKHGTKPYYLKVTRSVRMYSLTEQLPVSQIL